MSDGINVKKLKLIKKKNFSKPLFLFSVHSRKDASLAFFFFGKFVSTDYMKMNIFYEYKHTI